MINHVLQSVSYFLKNFNEVENNPLAPFSRGNSVFCNLRCKNFLQRSYLKFKDLQKFPLEKGDKGGCFRIQNKCSESDFFNNKFIGLKSLGSALDFSAGA